MEQREAEELARTLEMWASLGHDTAAGTTMLQAAAALREQAALIASLRTRIHDDKHTTCC
ncbi:hypothetical protein WBP07_03175 [Novosphingobium sp. BL-8A]|uniref:hypothetical protein n=1 Tax=Novosphingobium sp. BL-8A TaxID=3127639 RepID=UPI0037580900